MHILVHVHFSKIICTFHTFKYYFKSFYPAPPEATGIVDITLIRMTSAISLCQSCKIHIFYSIACVILEHVVLKILQDTDSWIHLMIIYGCTVKQHASSESIEATELPLNFNKFLYEHSAVRSDLT